MEQGKTPISQTIDDFKKILSNPSRSKNSFELAARGNGKVFKNTGES